MSPLMLANALLALVWLLGALMFLGIVSGSDESAVVKLTVSVFWPFALLFVLAPLILEGLREKWKRRKRGNN